MAVDGIQRMHLSVVFITGIAAVDVYLDGMTAIPKIYRIAPALFFEKPQIAQHV